MERTGPKAVFPGSALFVPHSLKNPVLLHALLCLSATYLKHLHPDTRAYDESILFHKHHALSLLQTQLALINTSPTTNDAIFGTSTLLVIQALGEFSISDSATSPNIEWLPLIKGSKAVIGPMWAHRNQSIFLRILQLIPLESITPESERRLLHKFNLTRLIAQLPLSYSVHVTQLADIIDPLFPQQSYDSPPLHSSSNSGMGETPATHSNQRLRHLFAWATDLPDSFIPRSQENDSAILTLLAWFYAALRELYLANRDLWWLERIADRGLADVMKFLDAENRRYQSLDNI